jgi:TolB-like protein
MPQGAESARGQLDILADSLLAGIPQNAAGKTMAVVPFTDNTGTGSRHGESVAEYMVTAVQKSGVFRMVDRLQFQKAMEEIALSQSDVIDENSSLKIGKILSASCLLTGDISKVYGRYLVNSRIINTETSEIIASAAISVNSTIFDGYSTELFSEHSRVSSSVLRSAVVPGWGQLFCGKSARGVISLAVFLGGAGTTGYFLVRTNQAQGDKNEYYARSRTSEADSWTPVEIDAFDEEYARLFSKYENLYGNTLVCGIATGCVWAINLIDAAVAGAQNKRSFRLYFSGTDVLKGRYTAGVCGVF